MRRLISDPHLESISAVILDEFHERHLHSDVSLAFLKHLQSTTRPDLRVVVMSATLDATSIAAYLGPKPDAPAPVIQADARQFEVSVEYLPHPPVKYLDATVKEALASVLPRFPGDVLIFLPGMGEIRRAAQAIETLASSYRLVICPLHGELSREEQDRAIQPLSAQELEKGLRKIILSTNVAETSLTIEGIRVVLDSGLHRMASHSWWSGVPALKTRPTSRASAIQRAGRAGRLGPGHCLRLYTRGDFEGRPMFDSPEIARADLAQTLLELKSLKVADLDVFPWYEKPQAQSLDASRELVFRLGALTTSDARSELTPLGQRMVKLPAHPRLARMLIEAERLGVLEDAASLASYIMESRIEGPDALIFLEKARMEESVWRVRSHLLAAFERKGSQAVSRDSGPASPGLKSKEHRLRFAILCGYPDRVAHKRPGQDPRASHVELLLSSGGSARIENTSAVADHDSFVILDLQERQHLGQSRSSTQVQALSLIEADWLLDLDPSGVQEVEEPIWDEARKRIVVSSRLTYGLLTLSESRADLKLDSPARAAAARILAKEALGLDLVRLSQLSAPEILHELTLKLAPITEADTIGPILARITLIARHFPESGLPDLNHDAASALRIASQIFDGKSSLSELKEIDWTTEILAACGDFDAHQLEELAPSFVQLPAGRKARIQYDLHQSPWLESRLQDFFGMKKGPSILKGRLPLTLHLLAPNKRALQVTTDLEGFWLRAYPELRHALSRRYPRHQWPEKP